MNVGIIVLTLMLAMPLIANAGEWQEWKKEVTLGADTSNGNTKKSSFNVNGKFTRALWEGEISDKFDVSYSSANGRMDSQKWENTTRYDYIWGEEKRWFSPWQFKVDHDRFADIDYRLTPSAGIGYWVAKSDDFNLSLENGLGYEYTAFRTPGKKKEGSLVDIARLYADKKVFEKAKLSEEVIVTPSLEGNGTKVKSETGFTNALSESLALSLRYIMDHNTDPAVGIKKTDTRFIAGLKYSF